MKRSTMVSIVFCCVLLIATSPAFAAGEWGAPPGGDGTGSTTISPI
jgi:hypothetical protein